MKYDEILLQEEDWGIGFFSRRRRKILKKGKDANSSVDNQRVDLAPCRLGRARLQLTGQNLHYTGGSKEKKSDCKKY